MDPTAPPGYDAEPQPDTTGNASVDASADSELPAYSDQQSALTTPTVPITGTAPVPRPPTEHVYELINSRGAWATLKLYSSAHRAESTPIFLGGDPISGTFALELDREDHILAIKLAVTGVIIAGGGFPNQTTFVQECKTLWSKDMGDPRSPDLSNSRYSGKLLGSYTFPFSVTLPYTVTLPRAGSNSASSASIAASGPFRLPETFNERQSPVTVQYDLELNLIRSRFRGNSMLATKIAYVPAIKPPEPSLLRQLAYQENSTLLGPEVDPDGWQQMNPFTVRGTVFKTREVDLHCKLFLAKPLCYTRGTALPCLLHLSSTDAQALDLLSSPHTPSVYLRRRVSGYNALEAGTISHVRSSSPTTKKTNSKSMSLGHYDINLAAAAWWPSTEGASEGWPDSEDTLAASHGGNALTEGKEMATRKLNGEIRLPQTLKPSCQMGDFCIEYAVIVLPFSATAFTSNIDGPLSEQTVEIATLFAKGPKPRAYAPPTYEVDQASSNNIGAQ